MNDQEINIAIAESVGWYPHPNNNSGHQKFWTFGGTEYGSPSPRYRMAALPPVYDDGIWGSVEGLPNYANDLNEMYQAKNTLPGEKRIAFIDQLCEVVNIKDGPYSAMVGAFYATARQQAEAFLKTINKWKQSESTKKS